MSEDELSQDFALGNISIMGATQRSNEQILKNCDDIKDSLEAMKTHIGFLKKEIDNLTTELGVESVRPREVPRSEAGTTRVIGEPSHPSASEGAAHQVTR